MPFPNDEQIMKTSQGLVDQLQSLFGKHPGFRPAHAKGILLTGTFTPSSKASTLSTAAHFASPKPVLVRFSNSTGLPKIPDADPNANPRGFAIRFVLGEHKHTDIIGHSTPHFPTRTGAEFLEFLQAVGASNETSEDPSPVVKFLGGHPAAMAFVQAPKPNPVSYAQEAYFGLNAFKLVGPSGKGTFVRYKIEPDLGVKYVEAQDVGSKTPNFLQEEIVERLKKGPVGFKILAQVAQEGDVTDDVTVQWPDTREVVELGSFKIEGVLPDGDKEAKNIIFDPIPRIDGVEPSADPLLEVRAAVYLISGKQRRAA